MTAWTRVEPHAFEAGDAGGDRQTTTAYATRWTRPLADGMFAVVTRTCYGIDAKPDEICVAQDTEYVACSDPDRPGDTEVGSAGADTTYDFRQWPTDAEWTAAMPGWEVAS